MKITATYDSEEIRETKFYALEELAFVSGLRL
jgi:hypothetical protein